ncbi:hypothetical protein SR41_10635 [Sphingomonas melonis]|uniref:Uncharacterized protein n=1 Tax=Sphingomonas melonis TaxID=152682 RepID=A0A0D1K182_9SPHN|nr:hypothetical protein [Sphingomonas melonis]KIU27273.1 hypothetical protein SR41_10635 [Sphingomonas melonis]
MPFRNQRIFERQHVSTTDSADGLSTDTFVKPTCYSAMRILALFLYLALGSPSSDDFLVQHRTVQIIGNGLRRDHAGSIGRIGNPTHFAGL